MNRIIVSGAIIVTALMIFLAKYRRRKFGNRRITRNKDTVLEHIVPGKSDKE